MHAFSVRNDSYSTTAHTDISDPLALTLSSLPLQNHCALETPSKTAALLYAIGGFRARILSQNVATT